MLMTCENYRNSRKHDIILLTVCYFECTRHPSIEEKLNSIVLEKGESRSSNFVRNIDI